MFISLPMYSHFHHSKPFFISLPLCLIWGQVGHRKGSERSERKISATTVHTISIANYDTYPLSPGTPHRSGTCDMHYGGVGAVWSLMHCGVASVPTERASCYRNQGWPLVCYINTFSYVEDPSRSFCLISYVFVVRTPLGSA